MNRPHICKHDRYGRQCQECDMEEERDEWKYNAERLFLLYQREREQNNAFKERIAWIRQRFDDEWTFELGVGEVVEEILSHFEGIVDRFKDDQEDEE